MTTIRAAGVVLASGALCVQPLCAQSGSALERSEEIRLARSAGPPAVSRDATVYVLGERGFERAVEGKNGFVCLVVRSPTDAGTLAPHCLDPLAAQTVLPAFQLEAKMQAQGSDPEAIGEAVDAAFESGALQLPSGPAYAYMLSSGQRLGQAGTWKPHFMMYVPFLTNADVGGDPTRPEFPFVGPREGHALSALVVVTTEFVDPADVTGAGSF